MVGYVIVSNGWIVRRTNSDPDHCKITSIRPLTEHFVCSVEKTPYRHSLLTQIGLKHCIVRCLSCLQYELYKSKES